MSGVLEKLKSNWKSGVTVALISIPLSVSLAVASHATPVQGIIAAIWAGILAALFGGSNYNIVGPTGALSGIIAAYAITNGENSLGMLAIVTGIIILLAFLFKLERYIVLIPASTIHGFTLGVAFIISLNQLNFILGLTNLPAHEKFIDNVIESFKNVGSASIVSVLMFVIFFGLLFVFKKYLPKFPGAIILAPVGIIIGYLSSVGTIPFEVQTLSLKFPVIEPKLVLLPNLSFNTNVIIPALTVALVAIIETMVSAKIADGMTKTKHNARKEMFGLALANIGSGLAGGIPATAALARTSLNVKTGANDKSSALISSFAVVAISFMLLGYFKYIPLPVIGAILVYVAVQMIEAKHFYRMFRVDVKSFVIAILVALITIIEDPIIGILFGAAISLLIFVEKMTKGQFELVLNDNKKIIGHISGETLEEITKKTHTMVYSIKGHLDYINGQAHISRFENNLNGYENIIIRLREVYFIDMDGVEALEEIIEIIQRANRRVIITGANELIEPYIKECKLYMELKKNKLVFPKTADALKYLGYKL